MYDNHHDIYETSSQTDTVNLSPTRPPQLNQTVCGCRCGRGNMQGGGGHENADDDAASTLVTSEHEYPAVDTYDTNGDEARNVHAQASGEEYRVRIWRFIRSVDGYHHRSVASLMESINDMTSTLPSPHHHSDVLPDSEYEYEYDDDVDSTGNEPGSGVHSVVGVDERSVRCISPGPELGGWMNKEGDGQRAHGAVEVLSYCESD